MSDKSGQMLAFEIENTWISVAGIRRLLKASLNASFPPGPGGDIKLRFYTAEGLYEVFEPFGDNSRYWVGPVEDESGRRAKVDRVHAAFMGHRVGLVGAILGLLGV